MPLLDRLQDGFARIRPAKSNSRSNSGPGGIGSGHGMVPFDNDMIVSKPAIVAHTGQIAFNFLAMCCFAGVAGFQAKWKVGPSGLTGFAIFVSIAGICLSLFMLLIPVFYEKYDKFSQLARTLKEVRVGFILTGAGVTFSLLIAFSTTISAFTQPGCKDAERDPHAKENGPEFRKGLPGWCNTKKAGAIFFWLAFVFWSVSLGLLIKDWRSGNLKSGRSGPRDPPFTHPPSVHNGSEADEDEDEESTYQQIPAPRLGDPLSPTFRNNTATPPGNYSANSSGSPFADPRNSSQAAGRPSMDTYGAFSDPAPTGFGNSNADTPRVSRTMQYADPYAAVRASIAGSPGPGGSGPQSPTASNPPSYENYSYR